jgi:hypothetical protein
LDKSNASYAFAVDGDVAVINPQKIEKYIDSSASLVFFERFKTLEVAACSFIVKNDAYGIQFLMDWARYYYKLPKNLRFDNSDNGALLVSFCTYLSFYSMKYIEWMDLFS